MQEQDYNNALSDFNTAINLSESQYAPAFYNRGVLQSTASKNHAAAEQDLTTAISLDSSFIEAYIKRASERIFTQNFSGALNDLEKAKQIDSTNVDIYYTRAKVLTNAMNFKEALPWYNRAITMDSTTAERPTPEATSERLSTNRWAP